MVATSFYENISVLGISGAYGITIAAVNKEVMIDYGQL